VVGLDFTQGSVPLPTYRDYFAELKKRIKEATPQQVADLLRSDDVQLADVRETDEWNAGHLPGAVHVPKSYLEQWAEDRIPDKNKRTVLYCAGGVRSVMAADALQKLGYTDVISMSGGFNRWKDSGLAWETPASFTAEQAQRYSRHLLIPEVGEAGQHKLLQSKVLLIGAGGLGSPAAYYLAAAGVGQLGIVDSDVVDLTNLQRQILHNLERVGEPKASSAKATLEALNPDVKVVPYQERLTSDNIDRIIADYDVIIDGADNFPTRYLLNDASVKWNKPVVHGSIYRFEGQVTVFKPHAGPCYRCLFPTPPPPEMAPSCAEAGVLGVLPGVIGTIQANEAIKLLLDIGEPLVGRYLLFDALDTSFREVKLRRDQDCPVCGTNPTITEYIDYEGFCASPSEWQANNPAPIVGKTAARVSTAAD
jgi:molybdopterin/thiamine biosynthesis adenylyltransferase/rhodanese-related sulfurtransferase